MTEIQTRYERLYDGRDESTLYQDLIDALGDDERALWQKEADFDLEHRSEYFEKYGEGEFEGRLDVLCQEVVYAPRVTNRESSRMLLIV